jgi:NAD-dependent SIR2 family protein deacetylase
MEKDIERAAEAIKKAAAILVGAGAGMGVDSGLPDFRGSEGFWRAYPAFEHLGLSFSNLANPRWFSEDPRLAWGFYGHRLHLYRDTKPHGGFDTLKRLAAGKSIFAFTSNVDGQFQRAGWSPQQVYEVHGSIHWMQCSAVCSAEVWAAEGIDVEVDESTFRAVGALPLCPRCGAVARPNILMFGDFGFQEGRAWRQSRVYKQWRQDHGNEGLVIIEIGAGNAVPTVRMECESLLGLEAESLVRINPRESEGPTGTISISMGGAQALEMIEEKI